MVLAKRIEQLNDQIAAITENRANVEMPHGEAVHVPLGSSAIHPGKGYIANNLVRGELAIFKTSLHWWAVVLPVFATAIFVWMFSVMLTANNPELLPATCCWTLPFAMLVFIPAYINYRTSEFGVTNRRILIKTGLINRKTLEMNLGKVESFQVYDTLFGRILGFNNLLITGSGGTKQTFRAVKNGKEFRQHVVENATWSP